MKKQRLKLLLRRNDLKLPWWSSWIRPSTSKARNTGSIPGQGLRSHMLHGAAKKKEKFKIKKKKRKRNDLVRMQFCNKQTLSFLILCYFSEIEVPGKYYYYLNFGLITIPILYGLAWLLR